MKRTTVGFIIGLCIAVFAAFGGCQAGPGDIVTENGSTEEQAQARVIVTVDFGSQVMLDELVTISADTNAMEALQQVAEIETAYGGGFVNAINSTHSGYSDGHASKEDWFISVNGIMTKTGALDYTLHPGDVEHWDFHNWGFQQFIPAAIGAFPEPFLHGYEGTVYPTIVCYQDGWGEDAGGIADSLSQLGVEDVSACPFDVLTDEQQASCNLVLLGTAEFAPIAELNELWKRMGFFMNVEGDRLIVYDGTGDTAGEYDAGVGFIQATQSPWNPKGIGVCENVAWMVSGIDEAGVSQAVDALINHHQDFTWACAAVVADGEVIRVPR